ncbi:MAG: hypothetical protein ACSW71_05225, partial [Methanobrevibacter sp.]
MNKKVILILMIILALTSIMAVTSFKSNQDFDGLFTMDIPAGQHFTDVAYCLPNGALGCSREYLDDNTGCELEQDDIMIFYYNDSYLVKGESNAWQHAVNDLTTSYFYQVVQDDGNSLVLTNDLGMKVMPPYL